MKLRCRLCFAWCAPANPRARRLTGSLRATMRGERCVAGIPQEACFKMACPRFAQGPVVYQGLYTISETAPVSQSSRVRGRLRFKGTEAIVLEHAAPCRRPTEWVVEGKWGGGWFVARFAAYLRGAGSLLINDGSGGGPVVWPWSRWESV